MAPHDTSRPSDSSAAEIPPAALPTKVAPSPPGQSTSPLQPTSDAGRETPAEGATGQPVPPRRSSDEGPAATPPSKRSTQPPASGKTVARGKLFTPEPDSERPLDAMIKNGPPWLVSSVFHMIVLIILGLWALTASRTENVELDAVYAEKLGDQLEQDTLNLPTIDNSLVDEIVLTPEDLPQVDDPLVQPAQAREASIAFDAMSDQDPIRVGLALSGREAGMKRALLAAYGGNSTTEEAVLRALRWLARNQQSDGSWSLRGPYQDGSVSENHAAATAMALLAFQGAGYTHLGASTSPFKKVVEKGWKWLLAQQEADGNFVRSGQNNHHFYTNAQCTMAVCELYGMTQDETLRPAAEKAVGYLVRGQHIAGGWRYRTPSDSDMSVTGWVVMALQSAKMAGIEVPYDTLERVKRFLDMSSERDGRRYSYKPGTAPSLAMTAEGLLCRQYLGWWRDDERLLDGTDYLLANPIHYSNANVYYWYYATQVCHHMEGERWRQWNMVMRQEVPAHQRKIGRDHGSWDPDGDRWGPHGGRLFVTCLSVYMLEVYYRHLPIYKYQIFDADPDSEP